jgi:type VI protein secretion system component VasF
MTSSTETITAVTAREGQADLFDLDAELADLTAADADSAATTAAAQSAAARAARKEQRAMATAWVALFAGAAISLGAFASIAWHDSVAANGTRTSIETTTAP